MVKAKVIKIGTDLANQPTLSIPEFKGSQLLILRGGFPMTENQYTLEEDGGFSLVGDDKLLLNETFGVIALSDSMEGVATRVVTRQYPHQLIATTFEQDAEQDDNGNWVVPDSSLLTQLCRAEPNSKGSFITGVDGKQIVYAWNIYLPLPVTELKPGTKVSIEWNGNKIGQGTVIRFSRGQLNARIWL
jgi:hypothetical protein